MGLWGKRWHHRSLSRMMFRCRMAHCKRRGILSGALARLSTGVKNEFPDCKTFRINLNTDNLVADPDVSVCENREDVGCSSIRGGRTCG